MTLSRIILGTQPKAAAWKTATSDRASKRLIIGCDTEVREKKQVTRKRCIRAKVEASRFPRARYVHNLDLAIRVLKRCVWDEPQDGKDISDLIAIARPIERALPLDKMAAAIACREYDYICDEPPDSLQL